MAHITIGGWRCQKHIFVQLKFANALWTYARRDGSQETATNLLWLGWYDRGGDARLFGIIVFGLSLRIGVKPGVFGQMFGRLKERLPRWM